MYVFAEGGSGDQIFGDDGDEAIIKCGYYNGDGTTNGSKVIDTGFEPQWVLIKRTDGLGHWLLLDNMRGIPFGAVDQCLVADTTAAENGALGAASLISLTSTGFSLNSTAINNSSQSYIYMAIRRGPMKEPSAGTDVYTPVRPSASGTFTAVSGFPTDLTINKDSNNGGTTYLGNRLTGVNSLEPSSTAVAFSVNFAFDFMNQITIGGTGDYSSWISWNFRRYPKVFDVSVVKSTSSSAANYSHNLGVAPEFFISKRVDGAGGWVLDQVDYYLLSSNGANVGSEYVVFENLTATTYGAKSGTFSSGETHLVLMFASLDGISKVGTYTGTGNDVNVTGLNAAARFVMIKRTDNTGDWYIFDTVTGIVSGNEAYNFMNSNTGVQTAADYIDPHSSGFTITSSAPDALNASGGTYRYLAFA